jgi:hypothetical protein
MGGYGKGGAPVDDAQVVAVRDDAHDRADELRGVLLAAARARRGALSHRAAGPETALEPQLWSRHSRPASPLCAAQRLQAAARRVCTERAGRHRNLGGRAHGGLSPHPPDS